MATRAEQEAGHGSAGGENGSGNGRHAPKQPTHLPKGEYAAVLKRTGKQFGEDKLTHWAAALTYYGVLSLFPALLALVSVLGLVGQSATQPLLDNVGSLAPGPARDILESSLQGLQTSSTSVIPFILGLAGAIWAASGYIGGFMDASNAVWDVPEGRPIWKKLPLRVGITIVMLVFVALIALAVVLTGPVAEEIGNLVGLGSTFVDVWDIAKWPVLVVLFSLMISLLYWLAPNVKQPGFPWVSPGGLLAVLLFIVASLGFAFYAANFGSYNKTYGSLGGIVIFLVWLWISNIAILLGAEFNSELERSRQHQAGVPLDKEPYLPMRDEPKEG